MGGTLAISAPLLKSHRVVAIFAGAEKMKMKAITDTVLLKMLLPMVLAQVIMCSLYTIFHEVNGKKGSPLSLPLLAFYFCALTTRMTIL